MCARGPPPTRGGTQFRKCHKPVPEAAQRVARRRRMLAMRAELVTELAQLEAEMAAAGSEAAAVAGGADGGAAGGAAMLGKAVQVCGLCNRSEYNGRRGRVLQYDEAAGRYAVRLEQEEGEEPEVGAVLLLRTDNM